MISSVMVREGVTTDGFGSSVDGVWADSDLE
jgi:hypothetical protein